MPNNMNYLLQVISGYSSWRPNSIDGCLHCQNHSVIQIEALGHASTVSHSLISWPNTTRQTQCPNMCNCGCNALLAAQQICTGMAAGANLSSCAMCSYCCTQWNAPTGSAPTNSGLQVSTRMQQQQQPPNSCCAVAIHQHTEQLSKRAARRCIRDYSSTGCFRGLSWGACCS